MSKKKEDIKPTVSAKDAFEYAEKAKELVYQHWLGEAAEGQMFDCLEVVEGGIHLIWEYQVEGELHLTAYDGKLYSWAEVDAIYKES